MTEPTCRDCHRPIRYTKSAGGWIHSHSRSVWCGTENGLLIGSCVLGPLEARR
jgi:hypothetical protein